MTFADRRAAKARRSLTDLTAYSMQLMLREPKMAERPDVISATSAKVYALREAG